MTGRPSSFTQEIGDAICERLADGESLRDICAKKGMPARATVFRWLSSNEAFRDQYAHAREAQADAYADDTVSIADKCQKGIKRVTKANGDVETTEIDMVERSRLQIMARQWHASKLAPKKYGDRITNEHTGANGGPIVIQATPQDNDL